MRKQPLGDIPLNTAKVASKAFRKGNIYVKLADELGTIYEFSDFAEMFPAKGQPAEHPLRLALVSILQFAEALSDRDAADAVRSRIDWKYFLHLDLEDEGFDFTVLSEFRSRLLRNDGGNMLFDKMIVALQERGLIKARGKQRTDSTHVLAAIRDLNRLELVHETLRNALESLAAVAPAWVRTIAQPEWPERYSRRLFSFNSPKTDKDRDKLARIIGSDGFALLASIDEATKNELGWLGNIPAVVILREVWQQQYTKPPEPPRFLEQHEQVPGAERIASPHDKDARFSTKRSTEWTGYKVHFSETCDENLPRIITNVATTPATTPDWGMLSVIHQSLDKRDLLPADHLVDTGYVSAESMVTSQNNYKVCVVGPPMEDKSWQARESGFDKSYFKIDWKAKVVTCPNGKKTKSWRTDTNGTSVAAFKPSDCHKCRYREICVRGLTPAGHPMARHLTLKPQAEHEALQAARALLGDQDFWLRYRERGGIEGTISQAARTCGARTSRYIGQKKSELQNTMTGLAINLIRTGQWLLGTPLATTRKSKLEAVCAA